MSLHPVNWVNTEVKSNPDSSCCSWGKGRWGQITIIANKVERPSICRLFLQVGMRRMGAAHLVAVQKPGPSQFPDWQLEVTLSSWLFKLFSLVSSSLLCTGIIRVQLLLFHHGFLNCSHLSSHRLPCALESSVYKSLFHRYCWNNLQ